jgi:hypothetical protein
MSEEYVDNIHVEVIISFLWKLKITYQLAEIYFSFYVTLPPCILRKRSYPEDF